MQIVGKSVSTSDRLLSTQWTYEENQPPLHEVGTGRIPWRCVRDTFPPYSSLWYKTKTWIKWAFGRYTMENYLTDILANELRNEIDNDILKSIGV